jgi:lipopolysaccharide heptosyltransferase I
MASRILIVKLSSMGDVVHTLPAAQALRARFPDAHLGWVVEQQHAELLRGQPFLDSVHVWTGRNVRSIIGLVRELRKTRWDVAIDFQGLLRSAVVAWASGARRRIGYVPVKELAHLFYTECVPRGTMDEHAVERSLKLAETFGSTWCEPAVERPYLDSSTARGQAIDGRRWFPLWPNAAERGEVARWLSQQGFDKTRHRMVVINPHCRKDANRWPAARYSALAARLLEHEGVRVAISGARSTRDLCDEIVNVLPDGAVWRADGQFGLLGATELFAHAAAIVTGDTGPMHLAVAVGTPVVALFGPASSRRTGPYTGSAIVLDHRLECAPCYADRQCPLGHNPPQCLAEITVEEVCQAVLRQIADRIDEAHTVPPPSQTRSLPLVDAISPLPREVGERLP